MKKCPRCKKLLKVWYALGFGKVIGCSDIKCDYKPEELEIFVGFQEWI